MRASHQWNSRLHKRCLRTLCLSHTTWEYSSRWHLNQTAFGRPSLLVSWSWISLSLGLRAIDCCCFLSLGHLAGAVQMNPKTKEEERAGAHELGLFNCTVAPCRPSQGYWALQGFSSDFYVLVLMKPPDPPPPFCCFLPVLSLSWSSRAVSISLEGTSVLTSSGTLAPLPICLGRPNCQHPCACLVWLCKFLYLLNPQQLLSARLLSLLLCGQSQKVLGRAKSFAGGRPIYLSLALVALLLTLGENVGLLQAALFLGSSGR